MQGPPLINKTGFIGKTMELNKVPVPLICGGRTNFVGRLEFN